MVGFFDSVRHFIPDRFIWIIPLALFILLPFIGAKSAKKDWNDEFLSIKQTKIIRGLCAVGVVLHHMAQKTAAPWLDEKYIVHGLDAFVSIGCFFVGVFFFASGFGLYKSNKSKENYLDGFIRKHSTPVITMFIMTSLFFFLYGTVASPYTWYVLAILYLYLAFYLGFKKCRSEKAALAVVGIATVLYCAVCDLLAVGTWCYNTLGFFFIGLIFARNEEKLVEFFKRRYGLKLLCSAAVMLGAYFLSEFLNKAAFGLSTETMYTVCRISVIILQFIACAGFLALVLLTGMKVRFRNKPLEFIGTMSLELYLIHGFYAQIFSYCFISEDVDPVIYIRNLPLYVLAVFAASLITAFLLRLLNKYLIMFFDYFRHLENDFIKTFRKDFKKFVKVACIVLAVILVYIAAVSFFTEDDRNAKAAEYCDEYITFADVDGKKMSAYVVGDSGDTLVLMRGLYDPCPSMSMRALADELSQNYHVIVLDYFGTGFSDDADCERTAENITREIHTALASLGVTDKYVLVPEMLSGLYAQYYVQQYHDEVKAVIGIDAAFTDQWSFELAEQNIPPLEYNRLCRKTAALRYIGIRAVKYSGLHEMFWQIFEGVYLKSVTDSELEAVHQQFIGNFYDRDTADEIRHEYYNYMLASDIKYPADVQVIDIVSQPLISSYNKRGYDIDAALTQLCEDPDMHITVPVVDTFYCVTYQVESIHAILDRELAK